MTRDSGANLRGILLVDDEPALIELLATVVQEAGLTPLVARDPEGAMRIFEKDRPAVAVIDLNLRPFDGFDLLTELRRRSASLPIIVLTGRANEDDKVRALEMGADDYVTKPFGHREIVARIRAHARRAGLDHSVDLEEPLEVGPLRLDPAERTLIRGTVVTRLTGTEFRLLHYLMSQNGAVVPTAAITRHVWGFDDAPAREVVRVTLHRLRRKLGDDGSGQRLIHTVPGVGLRLGAAT